jgi:hypothetical protein
MQWDLVYFKNNGICDSNGRQLLRFVSSIMSLFDPGADERIILRWIFRM